MTDHAEWHLMNERRLRDEMDVIREERLRCLEAAARVYQGHGGNSVSFHRVLALSLAREFHRFVDTGRAE